MIPCRYTVSIVEISAVCSAVDWKREGALLRISHFSVCTVKENFVISAGAASNSLLKHEVVLVDLHHPIF